jgi:hypothetical protein
MEATGLDVRRVFGVSPGPLLAGNTIDSKTYMRQSSFGADHAAGAAVPTKPVITAG